MSPPTFVFSWAAEEVIHDAECFRRAVVSEGRHGGESHQSLRVLLDEEVAADDHAVQPGVPSTEHRQLASGRGAHWNSEVCAVGMQTKHGGKGFVTRVGLEL